MSWLKKIIFLLGFSIAFTFAVHAKSTDSESNFPHSSESYVADSIHFSSALQPQSGINLFLTQKSNSPGFIKYFENFLIVLPGFETPTSKVIVPKQNSNRYEKVFCLLFPFHFFW